MNEYVFNCIPFEVPKEVTIDFLYELYEKYKIKTLVKILGLTNELVFEEEE